MHRSLALAACLALPAMAAAQATPSAGAVTFGPDDTIGISECQSTTATLILSWQISFASNTVAIPTGATYRILASNTIDCPAQNTSAGITTGVVADAITPTDVSQRYPAAGDSPLRPSTVLQLAGVTTCSGSDQSVYVCVRLLPSGGGDAIGNATGTLTAQFSAPVAPVISSVTPGEKALNVSWADGTGSGATATSWRVEATAVDPSQDSVTHKLTVTAHSARLQGLTNEVPYQVVVYAVSKGGNDSPASDPVEGTPVTVLDFWDYYKAQGGQEAGGCAGGPAGPLSLLAAAALARLLRRRS